MTARTRMTPVSPVASGERVSGWAPEVLILLVAGLLRFWRLGYHSIWFDEAVSLKWAGWAPADMWRVTFQLVEEKHPPLYYLFLHGWQLMLGYFGQQNADAWLRASGAVLGTLTVGGVLILVWRVSGPGVARAAGLLTALAPALVWYSQELRMFQPAATLLVWAAVCLAAAWAEVRTWMRPLLWLGMAALLVGAVHTYLFAALMLPAAGLTLLLLWWHERQERRKLLEGVLAFALTAALVFPLARNAWLVNSAEYSSAAPFAHIGATAARLLRSWSIWRPGWPMWLEVTALAFFGLLLAAGLLLPRGNGAPSRAAGPERGWLALWLGSPILLGNLMLMSNNSLFGEDRYFLFVAPIALWAVARGAVLLGRRLGIRVEAVPVVVAALVLLAALPVLWTPARYREQWRAAVDWIAGQVDLSPGLRSAIITHVDYTHIAAEWYLRPLYSFEELPLYHPFGGSLTPDMLEETIAPPLRGVETEGFDTLYFLQSHLDGVDDERLVEGWLAENYLPVAEAYPPGIKLTVYSIRSEYDELPPLAPLSIQLGSEVAPGLRLAACEVLSPEVAADDQALHPGPGWAMVRLWWQRDGIVTDGWHSSVRLANEAGVWGESSQRPATVWDRHPPSQWQSGAYMREDVAVVLNARAPAGSLDVLVSLVDLKGDEASPPAACGSLVVSR